MKELEDTYGAPLAELVKEKTDQMYVLGGLVPRTCEVTVRTRVPLTIPSRTLAKALRPAVNQPLTMRHQLLCSR